MGENYKLEGNANDWLYVSDDNKIKTIRLIKVGDGNSNHSFEIVSESENGNHELINSLLGKKISIEVNVLD